MSPVRVGRRRHGDRKTPTYDLKDELSGTKDPTCFGSHRIYRLFHRRKEIHLGTAQTKPEGALPDETHSASASQQEDQTEPADESATTPDEPNPYASNYELWMKALGSLQESERSNVKTLVSGQGDGATGKKFLASSIQDEIEKASKGQRHDSKARAIIDKSISMLNTFAAVVDVVVSSDLAHAALPWAAVRSILLVLNANNELNGQLVVGFAQVTWLLVQCDTYRDIYMGTDPALRPPVAVLDTLRMCVTQAYVKLQMFLSFAVRYSQREVNKMQALFKLEDVRNHTSELQEVKQQLLQAAENCEKLCNFSSRNNLQGLVRFAAGLAVDLKGFRDAEAEKRHEELLKWLCEIDPSGMYNTAREKHKDGTSDWLIKENGKFKIWEASPGSLLWLHGKAGSGKSILSSSVIDHLKGQCASDPDAQLAYFFFSFSDINRQNVSGMLSSLFKQLYIERPYTPGLARILGEYQRRNERPDNETLEKALVEVARGYSSVFIVVDALDECPELGGKRRNLLETLNRLVAAMPGNVHIFLTSRKEADIDAVMETLLPPPRCDSIDLTEHQESIRSDMISYMDSVFASSDCSSWPNELKKEAQVLLADRADGIFQYIFLQCEALRKLSSVGQIRKALQKLPTGLDAVYDRVFENIDPTFQSQVLRALMWLTFSREVLRVQELAEIFILRPHNTVVLDEDDRMFRPEDVLKYFSSLIVTEIHDNGYTRAFTSVRLCHFSVKEYLLSNRIAKGPAAQFSFSEIDAHLYIAHSSLAYHHSYPLSSLPHGKFRPSYERNCDSSSWLIEYAVHCWMQHVEMVPRKQWPADIMDLAGRALAARSNNMQAIFVQDAERNHHFDARRRHSHRSNEREDIERKMRPYCLTAQLGFVQLTEMMICDGPGTYKYLTQEDLDVALLHAINGSSIEVVKLLLERGANANAHFPDRSSPLSRAVLKEHVGIVELLLDKGAEINSQHPRFGSALQEATKNGCLNMMQVLAKRGADVNLSSIEAGCVVAATVEGEGIYIRGRMYDCLCFLLDNGADVDGNDGPRGAVLHQWITHADLGWDCLMVLLERGADVNKYSETWGYPLQVACATNYPTHQNLTRIKLLLDRGADVNAQGGEYGNALYAACASRHRDGVDMDEVKLLLDRGADVNAQGGEYGNALQAVCRLKDAGMDLVKILLAKGADVNAQGGRYGNALQAACAARHKDGADMDRVKLLLDRGADVNAQGGEYSNALQAAVINQTSQELVRLLVERGANVNAQGGYFGTVLQAACAYGTSHEIVQFLLDRGAEVNIQVGVHGSALLAACSPGCSERDLIMQLLLDSGADVNASAEKWGSALQAVAANDLPLKYLEILLSRGARVNQQGGLYGTALQAACYKGDLDKVRLLIDRGADVNARGGKFATALQAACVSPRSKDIIRILLDNGADVHTRGGVFGSAWHAVATQTSLGLETVRQQLLENGVDINDSQGRLYPTALHAAILISEENTDDIRFLLDQGADINLAAGTCGSPLQALCAIKSEASRIHSMSDQEDDLSFTKLLPRSASISRYTLDKVRFLLENAPEMDINAQGGLFGSALQAAAYWDEPDVVKLLLKHGANPNVKGGKYGNALNAAAIQGFWDIFQMILDAGAEPSQQQLPAPEDEWLASIKEEHGWGAVERYIKFHEVESQRRGYSTRAGQASV